MFTWNVLERYIINYQIEGPGTFSLCTQKELEYTQRRTVVYLIPIMTPTANYTNKQSRGAEVSLSLWSVGQNCQSKTTKFPDAGIIYKEPNKQYV